MLPLRLLPPGETAQIRQLTGNPDQVHRLEELGLRRGTDIEMVQSGSPCIVRIGTHKLCFRDNDALNVFVQPGKAS